MATDGVIENNNEGAAVQALAERANSIADALEAQQAHLERNVVRNTGLTPLVTQLRGLANEAESLASKGDALEADSAGAAAVAPADGSAPTADSPAKPDRKTRVLTDAIPQPPAG